MAIGKVLQYASTDKLYLDPKNPRLGRSKINANLQQEEILELMDNWTLDELAESFLESDFWPNEVRPARTSGDTWRSHPWPMLMRPWPLPHLSGGPRDGATARR